MLLTNATVSQSKPKDKPYKISDGQGMYLLVQPGGGKYWRLKYQFNKKEKILALGVYPEVSLSDAREKRMQARKLLASGIDPSQEKQEEKQRLILQAENSFESIAREWHESRKGGWTPRHTLYVLRRLEADVFPVLGHRPITGITAPELLSIIRRIEGRGALDIAHRTLQSCGQIFRYAIVTGRAEHNPTPDLKGAIKVPSKNHYARPQTEELPEFLQKLKEYDGHSHKPGLPCACSC